MRTRLALLSAAFLTVIALHAPVSAQSGDPGTTPAGSLLPVALTESVIGLSQAVHAHIEVVEGEMERLDDEARLRRIMSRRGKRLEPGWYARQVSTTATPSGPATWPTPLSEDSVEYGEYAGPVNPLILGTILDFNRQLSEEKATRLAGLIEDTARRYGVDPLLVAALVSQESAFYQSAVSPVGATGLGQLMPETAQDLGVNPRDARENLDGCVRYLADLLYYWSGSEDPTALALASYNAGAGNVQLYDGIPPFEETRNYVAVIKDRYAALSSGHLVSQG